MPETKVASSSVIRSIQIVFVISSILLLISVIASFTSIKRLVDAVGWVDHTYLVIINTDRIATSLVETESSHRGYVIIKNDDMYNRYMNSKELTWAYFEKVKQLTADNDYQQKNLESLQLLLKNRFEQMEKVLFIAKENDASRSSLFVKDSQHIMKGREIKDKIFNLMGKIRSTEENLMEERKKELDTYTGFTPILLVVTGLISLIITFVSYVRIKRDMDQRLAKQREDEILYKETSQRINQMEGVTQKVSAGDYTVRSIDDKEDDLGRVSKALNKMTSSLENTFTTLENKAWLQEGSVKIADAIRGERDIRQLTENLLTVITSYLHAPIATFYVNSTGSFSLTSSYSVVNAPKQFLLGDGLIGQAAKSKGISVISSIPADFVISSSIGNTLPVSVLIVPLVYENETIAVMELGFLREIKPIEKELMEENREAIAIGINSTLSYIKLQNLLEETQAQTEELQSQHSELENLNSELEAQSQQLQASEEELKVQQEELQQTNEELEERTLMLEERNTEIRKKAEELEISTRYKSEFLANMSHELRTPLNSILLLSRLLSENNEKNLSEDQTEYARVIQSSGNGLLGLIDEILDLSKIEAGKMELEYLEVATNEIAEDMSALFAPVAKNKRLEFNVSIQPGVPDKIETDKVRLEQIIKKPYFQRPEIYNRRLCKF